MELEEDFVCVDQHVFVYYGTGLRLGFRQVSDHTKNRSEDTTK